MLITLIKFAAGGTVTIKLTAHQEQITLDLSAHAVTPLCEASWDTAKIEMSRRLLETFAAQLCVSMGGDKLGFTLVLPSVERVSVLVIEDNIDTLQMWARYVENSHFSLIPLSEPEGALGAALEQRPGLIVLDVMMPGMDGWELLTKLRHNPATKDIPIIVCTVLPQQELAYALGASDFVCKPVTRRAFLDVLARQSEA